MFVNISPGKRTTTLHRCVHGPYMMITAVIVFRFSDDDE